MPKPTIYLDYAAATPLDFGVLDAMEPYFTDLFYNPSATYNAALAVKKDLEAARASVAGELGTKPSEIIFTAGGTEANNIALHGIMRNFVGKKMLVCSIEHEAVLAPAGQYGAQLVPVTQLGIIDVQTLTTMIDDEVVLISCMYANNEVGTVQPIAEIGRLVAKIRQNRRKAGIDTPLYFHTDACQAGNYLSLRVSRLGVDLMTINGGKMYGPKQSGALFCKVGVPLIPLIMGGGQERGLRSGTESIANAVGLSKALQSAQAARHDEVNRLQLLQKLFYDELAQKLPHAVINGSLKQRLPNNVHVTFPGIDNERLLMQLDNIGIMAAAGSACSASNLEPSHVLKAMGMSDVDARSSVRFSMGRATTKQQVVATVDAVALYC